MKRIPLSEPYINGNEWQYVKECFDTNWVSSAGSYVEKFEEEISKKFKVNYAIAVSNGTAALHLSLLSAGIGQDDEVIVPTVTFIAPVNAVRYVAANPVFMDCDEQYFNLDIDKTAQFIENECEMKGKYPVNKNTGNKLKAIIPVHVFGAPCDMTKLLSLAQKYNLKIIEDATESIGSKAGEDFTGAIGDLGCYSFNGNKIITTGGGGAVVTNSKKLADMVRHLSTQAKSDGLYYEHDAIGFNYRMSNITAAFGVAQLEQLDEFIRIKRANAGLYACLLENLNGIEFRAAEPLDCFSNKWFYSLIIDRERCGFTRDHIMKKLISEGIQCRPIWKLNHLQKPYRRYQNYHIETAQKIYPNVLNIPCSVNLTEEDINYITNRIKSIL